MNAKILYGSSLAKKLQYDVITPRVNHLLKISGHTPGLAILVVGNHLPSQVYVRNKIQACKNNGIFYLLKYFPANISEIELIKYIYTLNVDINIDGILVQLPLPVHINTFKVLEAISPQKDVDGFHVANVGALMLGTQSLIPCTPLGIMKLLEVYDIPIIGSEVVIIGRSNIIGKPIALILLQSNATITICHRNTINLVAHTRRADLIIVAIGHPKMLKGDMIKPGAVIVDVGINYDENGQICGDVDFNSAACVASAITPVPGGVGPMTVTMLLMNTIKIAEKHLIKNKC